MRLLYIRDLYFLLWLTIIGRYQTMTVSTFLNLFHASLTIMNHHNLLRATNTKQYNHHSQLSKGKYPPTSQNIGGGSHPASYLFWSTMECEQGGVRRSYSNIFFPGNDLSVNHIWILSPPMNHQALPINWSKPRMNGMLSAASLRWCWDVAEGNGWKWVSPDARCRGNGPWSLEAAVDLQVVFLAGTCWRCNAQRRFLKMGVSQNEYESFIAISQP